MALEPLPFAYAQGSPYFFYADYANRLSSQSSSKTLLRPFGSKRAKLERLDKPSDKVVTALRPPCLLRKHSWTSQASKARNRTVRKFLHYVRKHSARGSSSILVSRKRDKQIDMRCCLSEASSSNDYDNRTAGLRAQDVFALFLLVRFSFWRQKENEQLGINEKEGDHAGQRPAKKT